jgi:beta-mannosidase
MTFPRSVTTLNGTWRFRLDPHGLGEKFPDQMNFTHMYDTRWMDAEYDDSAWAEIYVPACWQAEGHDYNGIAWYRRTFGAPMDPQSGRRTWLQFDGVDYFADVWLNGIYLGSHEGYFGGFGWDVTPYLQTNNHLTVRVDSPREMRGEEHEMGQLKDAFKGALERWDVNNPEISPGGIWNDVKRFVTGPVRIGRTRVRAHPLSFPPLGEPDTPVPALITVGVALSLAHDADPIDVTLDFTVTPSDVDGTVLQASRSVTLVPGDNTFQFSFEVADVGLWWTWDLGTPALYDLRITASLNSEPSDTVTERFGVRKIERRESWETYLNGVRFFQRGANYLSDQLLSSMTRERYARDVELIKGANLNTAHPFCVVERQAFYDACDVAGILVYQDFPIWMMATTTSDFVRRALMQQTELIEQFGNHPCIGIWTYGSQPSRANFEKLCTALAHSARQRDPSRIVNQANAAFASDDQAYTDSERSLFWPVTYGDVIAQKYDWRYDVHLYLGWYSAVMSDLHGVPKEWLQLVTEYGAQSLPRRETLASFISDAELWPMNWREYARRCCQVERQIRRVPLSNSLDQYIEDTQAYQARFVKYHTEFYRRHKFRPCNGAHVFCFNDCWPAITWSVVEYDRTPKRAYYALKQGMAPLQMLLDCEERPFAMGEAVELPLCVVNDLPYAYPGSSVACVIAGEDGTTTTQRFDCDVPAVGIIDLAPVRWTPERAGLYTITLTLTQDGQERARNQYTVMVST